ncbi:MAG: hypothetical protein ACI9FJ_001386 [Alteromonadaceae bacterium]|jgi:hypothetical protein
MAQLFQAESLSGLKQYDDVIKQLAIIAPNFKAQYSVTPEATAEGYIQLLMLWGDTLNAFGR